MYSNRKVKDASIKHIKRVQNHSGGSAVYGLGLIGAFVYFLGNAHSFMDFVWAIIKSIIWPAIFTYKIFEFFRL